MRAAANSHNPVGREASGEGGWNGSLHSSYRVVGSRFQPQSREQDMHPRLNPRPSGAYEEVLVANRKQRRAAERAGETAQDTTDLPNEQGGLPEGMPAQPFPDHEEDAIFKVQMRVIDAKERSLKQKNLKIQSLC